MKPIERLEQWEQEQAEEAAAQRRKATESHDSVPEPARSYPIAVDWWAECFPQWKGQR